MIGEDIEAAKRFLSEGKLVGIPTETVYGLAANALNDDAVLDIYKVKERPHFDPLIIHLSSWDDVNKYVKEVPSVFDALAKEFVPGPITFLLKKKPIISDLLTAGSDYVAVRIPSHSFANRLLKRLDFPLAAPSANPFGYISPTTAKHVEDQLGTKIPYILDGGECEVGLESTIVGMQEGRLTIFRKGGLSIEELEKICNNIKIKTTSTSNPKAPGMLSSHYAPKTKFVIGNISELIDKYHSKRIGVISYTNVVPFRKNIIQERLTKNGELRVAAKNLFAIMRKMDKLSVDLIIAEYVPDVGLGVAINDRLRRAAFQ